MTEGFVIYNGPSVQVSHLTGVATTRIKYGLQSESSNITSCEKKKDVFKVTSDHRNIKSSQIENKLSNNVIVVATFPSEGQIKVKHKPF